MEVRQLEYFVAAAEIGNFTQAAAHCGVSQPSLSAAIAKLELAIGRPLFERLGKRVQLTESGKHFLERAQQILALIADARDQISGEKNSGTIRIGAIPTVAPYLLPRLIKEFSARKPGTQVDVFEDVTKELIRMCIAGEIDMAILALPIQQEPLKVIKLFEEPLLLCVSRQHPLAKKKEITWNDLREDQLLMLDGTHCLAADIAAFCRQRKWQPITLGKTQQLTTVQELIALNLGISFIPEMAQRSDTSKSRVYRSLVRPTPLRTLGLVRHAYRYLNPTATEFMDYIQAASATELR